MHLLVTITYNQQVTTKQDLWEVARTVAFDRLGLLPLRRTESGRYIPPGNVVSDETRKARRKYRKLWRRNAAAYLKHVEKDSMYFGYHYLNKRNRWVRCDDKLTAMLGEIEGLEVGERPSKVARSNRWAYVLSSKELESMIKEVARELGLLRKRRK